MTLENASAQFDHDAVMGLAIDRAIADARESVGGVPGTLRLIGDPMTWWAAPLPGKSIDDAIESACIDRLKLTRHNESYGPEYRADNLPPAVAVEFDRHDIPAVVIVQIELLGGLYELQFNREGFARVLGKTYAVYVPEAD